ncbi:MAG: hypothetical protein JW973_18515 [Bacteroidales bacterium]|nr:hypothetical protein [Bacteroidales bacterium]
MPEINTPKTEGFVSRRHTIITDNTAYDQSFISGYYRHGTHEIMIEYRMFSRLASTRVRCGNELFGYH